MHEGVISIIDPKTATLQNVIRSDDRDIRGLAFSPDGRPLAGGGLGKSVRLWDPATGHELLTLEGHRAQINDLDFSPDGSTLVSADHSGAMRVWRADPAPPRDDGPGRSRGVVVGSHDPRENLREHAFSPREKVPRGKPPDPPPAFGHLLQGEKGTGVGQQCKKASMYNPELVSLSCRIPETLRRALDERRRTTGETIDAMVAEALGEYLQAGGSTLFQVSTAGALVEGVHEGAVSVHFLKQHGDLGLGTFTNLDGEMAVVDGRCYQVRSDGSVHEVNAAARSPYAVLTRFNPGPPVKLGGCAGVADLHRALDALRSTDNLFYAYRIDGLFSFVRARAVPRVEEGTRLLAAAAKQPEFDFHDVRGTLVGFWSPGYVKVLTVPGYHFHFLTEDRKAGGHLLDCRAAEGALTALIEREANLRIALPETPAFLGADLSRDGSPELDQAEKAKGGREGGPEKP